MTDHSLRQLAVRGAVTVVGRGFVIRVLGLAGTIVLARLLSPADFGVLALGLALQSLTTFLAGSGLNAALVKAEDEPSRSVLGAVLGLQLAVTLALSATAFALALLVGGDHALAIAIMVAAAPLVALRVPATVRYERDLDYRPIAVAEVAETVVYQAWSLTFAALGAGVVGVATASLARSLAGSVLLVARDIRRHLPRPRPDRDALRRILPFGLQFQAPWAVEAARFNAFNAIVSSIGGLATLGLWSIAVRLIQPIQLVQHALERVSFSASARAYAGAAQAPATVARTARVVALALGAGVAPLVAVALDGVPAVLGAEWDGAGEVLAWAAIALVLTAPLHVVVYPFLYVTDRGRIVLLAGAAAAATSVAAVAVAVALGGAQGVGVAVTAAALVEVLAADRLGRTAGLRVVRAIAAPVVISVLATLATVAVVHAVDGTAASTAAGVVVGLAAFAALTRVAAWDAVGFARRQLVAARAPVTT